MRSVPLEWVKNLKEGEEKESFVGLLRTSPVTRRFKEIADEKLRNLDRAETTKADYTVASWSHQQADRNGYRRCLLEFLDLLEFVKEQANGPI